MRPIPSDSRAESHHQSHHFDLDEPQARLRAIEERLVRVGSAWNPQLQRWTCPAHREGFTLSVRLWADGFVRLECERRYGIRPGCDLGAMLDALGLSGFDLAPARFRA